MAEKKVIQGEDIIVLVDSKTTLHATTHNLKVDLELKELRTKDTNGKEQSPGDISWSVEKPRRRSDQIAAFGPCEDLPRQGVHHLVLARRSCRR